MNKESIINEAKKIYPGLQEIRRNIHRNPELSFMEFNTSELIRTELQKLDIPYKEIAGTGVIGIIGKGSNCVALRADIDALPITEETGLEFSSQNHGIMHACGHDMHSTMLLGAAKILKSYENELNGCVKLIFQPGEEQLPGGASILIKDGVLDNPRPQAIFGQHVSPGDSLGKISFGEKFIMASADELYWTITGRGCHAAQPHLGNDTILAASQLITNLQSIVSRLRNPLDPGVLSVTSIHGGSATNIIPEKVELKGTLRSFNNEWRMETLKLIGRFSIEICALYGCDCSFDPIIGYPPVYNNPETTSIARETAKSIFGTENVLDFEAKMWAEDFAYYGLEIPATFWFLGAKNPDVEDVPGLHNPKFIPEEESLIYGTAMLAGVAMEYLDRI